MGSEMVWEEVKSNVGLWLPKVKGDSIEGVVVEVRDGQYGRQLVIQVGDSVFTTPSHKALQSHITNFVLGDAIKITFTGTDLPKVKGQNPTNLYVVCKGKKKE